MNRPTISLACIMKNEAHNIGPLLSSVRGCFDEIVMVDTGSTDSTLEFIEQINKQVQAGTNAWDLPEIKTYNFDWVNDFSKARNFSFEKCTKDYIAWLDLDDCLSDAKKFIKWRDTVMHSAHYWMAVYNYAFNPQGAVECKFVRERVIKRNHGFKWEYPVHEGLLQKENKKYWPQRVNNWWVDHRRTEDDKKTDHMRNVKIMESLNPDEIKPRMKFYLGKELFENGFPEKSGKPLMEALAAPELDLHDRILSIQYAAQSAMAAKAYPQVLDLLYNGLKIMPSRAEYWALIGDCYLQTGQLDSAVQAYKSGLQCSPNDLGGVVVVHNYAYMEYPLLKLTEIYLQTGNFIEAEPYIKRLHEIKSPQAGLMQSNYEKVKDTGTIRHGLPKTDDVIITCPAGAMGNWDEGTLEEKGHGGSETAAIEVAKWIKQKTNRRVKIFQTRNARATMPSGVEYNPIADLPGYLQNIEPKAHIAWRHAVRLTPAQTYVWCHDLQLGGAEKGNYDKIVALSEFHKNYLIETNGVQEDKIVLGFNGINPNDFPQDPVEKDPLKVIFSSSPDRGLIQSVDIVKAAREISGMDIKLHCFYGTDNMRKMGQAEWADKIEKHMSDNKDFVVYHGMVNKKTLMKHFAEAGVWLYPADFIETFCITAIEALCAGCFPIVRPMGALPFTLNGAIETGMCDLIDVEVTDAASTGIWANRLVSAILDKSWERVKVSLESKSWERVAEYFIKEMSL
jgi:glycosyltransferase involved in cell wall biosynthesis